MGKKYKGPFEQECDACGSTGKMYLSDGVYGECTYCQNYDLHLFTEYRKLKKIVKERKKLYA